MNKATSSLTFGQTIFILTIFLFSSFIFFYLGARFGPELLNLDDQRLAANAPILPDEIVQDELKKIIEAHSHNFIFHDALQNKKQLADLEMISAAQKQAFDSNQLALLSQAQQGAAKAAPPLKPEATIPDEPPVLDASVLATMQSPVELLDTDLQAQAKTEYHLQLGSFADKAKANESLAIWIKRGFSGLVSQTRIEGKGLWYRIELGGYSSQAEAEAARQKMMKKYGQSARIVKVESM